MKKVHIAIVMALALATTALGVVGIVAITTGNTETGRTLIFLELVGASVFLWRYQAFKKWLRENDSA